MKISATIVILFLSIAALGAVTNVPKEKWTFTSKAPPHLPHAMGLIKPHPISGIKFDEKFKKADIVIPADFDLTTVTALSPILDQGQCGSCVYHSVTANFADSWLLRGENYGGFNKMSAEFLMTSSLDQGSGCNGSYFTATAPATANGVPLFSDCPYAMGQTGCVKGVTLHGKTVSNRLIDPSVRSIASALVQKYPVSNTVGADNNFQSYSSGIFNACSNTPTNHETLIVGYSCETSRDSSGNCVFDSTGNLPAGVGYWKARNSWSTSWGESGFYRIKMTDANGNKCNNFAEEVGVLETGTLPPAPPTPTPVPVPPAPAPPTPTTFDWALLKDILLIVGAAAGVVALVVVLLRK